MKLRDIEVKEYHDLRPYLDAVHTVKVEGADFKVEVRLDLTKKEVNVKKI